MHLSAPDKQLFSMFSKKTRGKGEKGEEAISMSGISLIAGSLDSHHGKEQYTSAGWVCEKIPKLSVPAQSLLGANTGLQKGVEAA